MDVDEPDIRFKAKKRTKTLRHRDRSTSPATPAAASRTHDAPATPPADERRPSDASASAVQAALKLRHAARAKSRFRGAETTTSLVLREPPQGLPDRFMHQTGFISDAQDKHMMAYVESRLSTRAGLAEPAAAAADDNTRKSTPQQQQPLDGTWRARGAPGTMQTGTSTTSFTRLVEVQVPVGADTSSSRGRKRAAAPDAGAKPAAPARRRRNRRGSDDMKRDAMVEAFLSENKLDVYDVPAPTTATTDPSRSADDVLADDFRQQYLDEVAARRLRRRPAVNQPRGLSQKQQAHQLAVAAGEVLKGPKLGGSRNARAAVRDALLQQQELGKKRA
ncbi:hypothetical protein A9K55_003693 [Cordyceps militaris]|uniref:mRNA splicing factor RNA helicase n=1 Tax=Cordyceps militaris TaxID=73501 RepID=A0A2H4S5T2_CORMI|nr:hypothetical protein A9K55_003693 [Cordyceps militaris]